MEIGGGTLYVGGVVTNEDLTRAKPWTLDDEIRTVSDGWAALMPDERKDDELRALETLRLD